MNIGIRIFLVDKGSVKPFPLKKFESMIIGDPSIQFPDYAGKRLRYALVFVESENRRPIEVTYAEFSYLQIGADGRFDLKWLKEKKRESFESIASEFTLKKKPDNVIDAKSRFIKRRNMVKNNWKPTEEELSQIFQLVFKT